MDVTYHWRGEFENAEINALHAEAFGGRIRDDDWVSQVQRHSLGWVCARGRSRPRRFRQRPLGR